MKEKYPPKISVIIPCYNVAAYLRAALNTVRFQTLTDFEAICVDDGSTDETGNILDEWAAKDARFVVVHKENAGVAEARNTALSRATGEFVAFLDPDDLYHDPNVFEVLYNTAVEEDVAIVGGGVLRFADDGREIANGVTSFKTKGYLRFDDYQFDYGFYRFLFSRKLLERDNIRFPKLTWYEDPVFFVQAVMSAGGFYAIPDIVYRYRKAHKKTDWFADNFKKVNDLLVGLLIQLKFAKEHAFYKLEETIYNRRRVDFFAVFEECAKKNPDTKKLLSELDELINECRHMNTAFPPKVSIVIPSLNSAGYYRECLTSVVSQTLNDIEIICVDAGSEDETLDILQEFAVRDSRIKTIHSGKKSYGHQINLGFDAAKGEYLGIVESDDYIDANMMKRLYDVATTQKLDFVKSNMVMFRRTGTVQTDAIMHLSKDRDVYGRILDPSVDPSLLNLRMNNCTGIYSARFIRENNIRHNETPGASFQDNGFWFRVFVTAKRVCFLDESYYYARRDNPGSSVKSKEKVYCVNEEYADIANWLCERPKDIRIRFAPYLTCAKFKACNFTFSRISDGYKFEYAMCMYGIFKDAKCSGVLDVSLFDGWSLSCLNDLLRDPVGFAFRTQSKQGCDKLKSMLLKISSRFSALEMSKINHVVASTVDPRGKNILKRMMYCYKDNGLKYTIKRILFGRQY